MAKSWTYAYNGSTIKVVNKGFGGSEMYVNGDLCDEEKSASLTDCLSTKLRSGEIVSATLKGMCTTHCTLFVDGKRLQPTEEQGKGLAVVPILCVAIIIVAVVVLLGGCTTSSSMAYTYAVDTGDNITIRLNTKGGYELSSDVPFAISCDGEELSQGTFMYGSYYEYYVEVIEGSDYAELLDSGETDGNQWIFWSYDNSEYDYAILIGDSNTMVILGNIISEESARECFERLTFSVAD